MLTVSGNSIGQTDAELVAASRGGDREAFGAIVRRYQAMITGVIYAACGDLHRSEDLAQETFVSAWKSLSGLRDASKLPAWLCQVARHRLLDNSRSESRRDARVTRAFQQRSEETEPSPQEQVLSGEERELLWQTLREIPQPYRETLVLYYRQEKSVEDVALAMDTTDANVRQRLSRGREMLREQVARMLERNLVRSAPGPTFAVAVIAALPALIPQTAAAATIGAVTVKTTGAAAAKSTGLLATLAMWAGPIIGVGGGIVGTWVSIRNTETPRERRFVVRNAVWVWLLVIGFLGTMFAIINAKKHFGWSNRTYLIVYAGLWAVYATILPIFIVVQNRRHRALRKEEGLLPPTAIPNRAKHMGLGLVGATIGSLAWMINMAARAGDTTSTVVIAFAAVVLSMTAIAKTRGRTIEQIHGFTLVFCTVLAAITFVMLNWRFHAWMVAGTRMSIEAAHQRVPLWLLNLFTAMIYASIFCAMHFSLKRAKATASASSPAPPAGRD